MKKLIVFMVLMIFLTPLRGTFADYDIYNSNSSSDREKIELIESYIINHKRKIDLFAEKYNINNDVEFDTLTNDLNDMIVILGKLSKKNIEPERLKEILDALIVKLKTTNIELKKLLQEKKSRFELKLNKKKKAYSKLGKKVGEQLNKLIIGSAKSVSKKNISNEEKRIIIKYLIELEKDAKRLNNFDNIQFSDEQEIKIGFLRILKNIKRNILAIKKELTN